MRIKARNRLIIAIALVVLFGFVLVGLFLLKIPEGNADVLKVTLGALSGSVITMAAFYFGDSDGKEEDV